MRLRLGIFLLQLASGLAVAGQAAGVSVTVHLDRPAGRASPLLYGCSLPAPGTPRAAEFLPELLRNRSFEEPALTGPRAMPPLWSRNRGWELFAYGGKHMVVRTERGAEGPLVILNERKWPDCRLVLLARKIDGPGGLSILFEVQDERNHVRWTLGANGNRQHVLESVGDGKPRPLAEPVPGRVDVGRVYRVEMSLRNHVLQCLVDGHVIHQVGGLRFRFAGFGFGASDCVAQFLRIAAYGPNDKPLFLMDDPAKADNDTLASGWTPLRSGRNKVRYQWDALFPFNSYFSQGILVSEYEGGEAGICQGGVAVTAGATYRGRIHLRGTEKARVTLSLRRRGGETYAAQDLGELSGTWAAHDFTLKPGTSDPQADFCVSVGGVASVWVDEVSLAAESSATAFGLRGSVVAALKALKPTLLCWPTGPGASHYHWRKGVGPRGERPVACVTDGTRKAFEPVPNDFGTDEFIALCRDLGAEPVIVLNPKLGIAANLDWLEYCNGAPTSAMGRLRALWATNGHDEPYGVRYWLVGGERWDDADSEPYPVTARALGRDVRGYRPEPRLIALGRPGLAEAERDVADLQPGRPMVTHVAKPLEWSANDAGRLATASALRAAIRALRKGELNVACVDWVLDAPPSASALPMGHLLNLLDREGGGEAIASFRLMPPLPTAEAVHGTDLIFGLSSASPAQAVWSLFRSSLVEEVLATEAAGATASLAGLDVAAGRRGNQIVVRLVCRSDRVTSVQLKLEGLGGRRLAQRATRQCVTASTGTQGAVAVVGNDELPVQGGCVDVPLPRGEAAHLIVLTLEGG